tara:strand:- start:23359 stop:24030 length:672 start_codon:yes stop_codon:yes gene_type:complete
MQNNVKKKYTQVVIYVYNCNLWRITMSIECLLWSKTVKDINCTDKLCLTWLCNYAQEDNVAWATENHLADIMNSTPRTVRRSLKNLQEKNLIKIISRFDSSGRQIRNDYKILINDIQQMSTPSRTQVSTLKENNKKNNIYTEDFNNFWLLYPRQENKYYAFECWNKAIKKTEPEDIMRFTKYFIKKNKNTDLKFIPHASTYLNRKIYLDYENFTRIRKDTIAG